MKEVKLQKAAAPKNTEKTLVIDCRFESRTTASSTKYAILVTSGTRAQIVTKMPLYYPLYPGE
jgi:hypothetical protein